MQHIVYALQMLLGSCLLVVIARRIRSYSGFLQSFFYLDIILGQIVAICFLYFFSALARGVAAVPSCFFIAQYIVPLSALCFLVVPLWKQGSEIRVKCFEWFQSHRVDLLILFFLCLCISYYELPRTMMLSSDPDQHLFYSAQINRFGFVPFSQFAFGNAPFGYPVGFASLVVVWSWFSSLSIPHALTVQPLLQCALALGLLSELITQTLPSHKRYAVTILIAICCVFVTPWVLSPEVFHFEATARVCSTALVVFTLMTVWFSPVMYPVISGMSLTVLGLFNPSLLPIPLLAIFIRHVRRFSRILGIGVGVIIGVLFDSYYLSKIFPHFFVLGSSVSVAPVTAHVDLFSIATLHAIGGRFFSLQASFPNILIILVGSSIVALRSRRLFLTYCTLPFVTVSAVFIVQAVVPHLGGMNGASLLIPYMLQSLDVMRTLYWFACIAFIASFLFERMKAALFFPLCIGGMAILAALYGQQLFATPTRQAYCPDNQCLIADDLVVIRKISEQFKQYISEGRPQDFVHIPKILLPNAPVSIVGEQWLLPTGASRVLPLYDMFPLAFFYSQGSPEYSFETYQQRVCRSLDMQWLLDRNIRYVFLPSYHHGCIRGLSKFLSEPDRVVYQSGKAALIDISAKHRSENNLSDSKVDN